MLLQAWPYHIQDQILFSHQYSIQLMSMTIYSASQNQQIFSEELMILSQNPNRRKTAGQARNMVTHSAYLNIPAHSCLYELEKYRSRTVTYYNNKGQTQEAETQNCL